VCGTLLRCHYLHAIRGCSCCSLKVRKTNHSSGHFTGDQFNLDAVTFIEACKVVITPAAHNRGCAPPGNRWNVDGEVLNDDRMTLTNMLHSMKIYGCSARNEYVPPKPAFRYGRRWRKKRSRKSPAIGKDGYPLHMSTPCGAPTTPGGGPASPTLSTSVLDGGRLDSFHG
jgi:hypothetical protein